MLWAKTKGLSIDTDPKLTILLLRTSSFKRLTKRRCKGISIINCTSKRCKFNNKCPRRTQIFLKRWNNTSSSCKAAHCRQQGAYRIQSISNRICPGILIPDGTKMTIRIIWETQNQIFLPSKNTIEALYPFKFKMTSFKRGQKWNLKKFNLKLRNKFLKKQRGAEIREDPYQDQICCWTKSQR